MVITKSNNVQNKDFKTKTVGLKRKISWREKDCFKKKTFIKTALFFGGQAKVFKVLNTLGQALTPPP